MKTHISAPKGFQLVDFKELWRNKDLLYFLVLRDITVHYRQTIMGFAWALIRPLFSMGIFSIVFGHLAKLPSDGIPYPVFCYIALVPWTYFSSTMTSSTQSIVDNTMITKVYFPRLLIPLAPAIANLVDFSISLSFLAALMIWFHLAPTINIIYLPILITIMILSASGIGMWLSSLAVQYRDVKFAATFLSQLLMYAAPVVWSASLIPEPYRLFYGLYPMVGVIEGFRAALIWGRPMPWDLILMSSISSCMLWITGALYFKFKEQILADVI